MYPTLFKIGPFTIYSLWVLVIAGLIISTMLFLKTAKYRRMDVSFILDHSLSLLIGTVFLSRLIFFLTNWGYFGPINIGTFFKQLFFFWQPGFSFWGAIVGFILVFIWHCKRKKEDPLKWLEIAFVPFLIALMFGNFGQFLDGQGYGHETILPWGIVFESTNVKYTVPIHPTQIYSILLIIAILLTRKKISNKWKAFKDDLNWIYLAIAIYSFMRFWLEFLRGDDTLQLGPIRLAQIVSLVVFIYTSAALKKRIRTSNDS